MKLINIKDYLLLIDKEGEIIPDKTISLNLGADVSMSVPFIPTKDVVKCAIKLGKILAYYPLTKEAKELDLPLLPNPFENKVDIYQLSLNRFPEDKSERFKNTDFEALRIGFVEGYKAAQSKQFSLEDVKNALRNFAVEAGSTDGVIDITSPASAAKWIEEYIKLLSTQKLPNEFIVRYEMICCGSNMKRQLKTITNSEGKQELIGKYEY